MKKFELYDGEVELEFDEDKHKYMKDGNYVPSVTTICGIISKDWFPNYIKSQARMKFDELCKGKNRIDVEEAKEYLRSSLHEYKKHGQEAANIGTKVHETIENMLRNKRDNDELDANWGKDEGPSMSAFLKFYIDNNLVPKHLERKTCSKKHNYAGTVDFIGKFNGEMSIVDWKTSSAIRDKHKLQLAAYYKSLREEFGDIFEQAVIVNVGKESKLTVVKLDKEDLEKYFEIFKAAKKMYDFKKG